MKTGELNLKQVIRDGGLWINANRIDGSSERVRVLYFWPADFERLCERGSQSDIEFIECVTGNSPGWADNLTAASQQEILELGRTLNFQRFVEWYACQSVAGLKKLLGVT